ncbi:MAG: alpha/beta fold hydrolase [Anaerolineales bacterium]|jgi:3-oxoadipate enol-lactonase
MIMQIGNLQLNVEDRGSGRPLLLIHGFPLNLEMWRPQIESLSTKQRIIAIDLRGHGLSPSTPGPYPMRLLAEDCAALIKALEVDQPLVVCGFSMGGYISFSLYRHHPDLFSGLILASTRAGADTDQGKTNRGQAIAKVRQQGIHPVIESMLPALVAPKTYRENHELVQQVTGIMEQTSPEGMISALQGMMERPDSTGMLGEINVPTLIVHALDDQIISISDSEAMHTGIPNSQLEIIPEAGHLLNLEQEKKFNEIVTNFINSI